MGARLPTALHETPQVGGTGASTSLVQSHCYWAGMEAQLTAGTTGRGNWGTACIFQVGNRSATAYPSTPPGRGIRALPASPELGCRVEGLLKPHRG